MIRYESDQFVETMLVHLLRKTQIHVKSRIEAPEYWGAA